ncbi:DUF1365 domain-containing protein [Rhodococcus sp. MTM3W5.2]|uniref:DUF1365 domain-containing protein n=1 Tax=Rhodococcus sp. MTM3W5.2 TaxID=1805827 RepID=UPI0039838F78
MGCERGHHGSAGRAVNGSAALYRTRIRHVRTEPVHNAFGYRSYSWFIDLDALPRLPWWLRPFAGFRAEDHLEPGGGRTLRDRVDALLAVHGIDLRGGRVTALMNARVLGYVFNPLSLFWCHDKAGDLRCVLAEVHNTYGGRHCYLVRTDRNGRAETDKRFYVSPFNEVDGVYAMRLTEPSEDLDVRVVLYRDGRAPFAATMRGRRRPATAANVVRALLAAPLAPLVVAARIRVQGVRLWARGVPIAPRPATEEKERAQ